MLPTELTFKCPLIPQLSPGSGYSVAQHQGPSRGRRGDVSRWRGSHLAERLHTLRGRKLRLSFSGGQSSKTSYTSLDQGKYFSRSLVPPSSALGHPVTHLFLSLDFLLGGSQALSRVPFSFPGIGWVSVLCGPIS